ncbi:hypothetical protein [Nesterenkonia rhizosphaerae]|uniref:Prepilin type IV endopeptidase peptidase domain-containing protein n=1 Tax=Nesterenkonia rhizosphaerae TaxID=1348272 RepID=A0ABP9G3K2_9MICC
MTKRTDQLPPALPAISSVHLQALLGASALAVLWILSMSLLDEPLHVMQQTAVALAALALGGLAVLDAHTGLIRNRHNIAVGIAATVWVLASAFTMDGRVILTALATAAGCFALMLTIRTVSGSMVGGGDLKLIPSIAALLATCHPLCALIWICLSFIASLAFVSVLRVTRGQRGMIAIPFGPPMAVALIPAVLATESFLAASAI